MDTLKNRHLALIASTPETFKRSYLTRIPWNERLVGIKGARGVGKTTLLLQYIKKIYADSNKALYVSLDDLFFTENRLIDLSDEFVAKGGQHLFLDEVHKYPNWSVELKNIYDYHPKLKVVFTGSSLLEIINSRSDLSRRALVYNMQGLSFREFLELRHGIRLTGYSLPEILENHTQIAIKLGKIVKPLAFFAEYLRVGYFPFYENNETLYFKRLEEVINLTLEVELPSLRKVEIANIPKIKKLLYIISQSVPFKPNITALAQKTKITRNSLLEYLHGIDAAQIISTINKDSFGVSLLQKPKKVFMENTNYAYALSAENPNIGNIRETFFLNQLRESHRVTYPEKADFLVNEKYLFEIGGKNKTKKQIQGQENAYIVSDDIEFGTDNRIPLWLFGFLY